MPQRLDEWSDQYWDRAFARHTAQVETVKLVVTFSLAVAAALVGSALEVPPTKGQDRWASFFLATAFIATLASIFLDRLKWPKRNELLDLQRDMAWSDPETLTFLQLLNRYAEQGNRSVVRLVRGIALLQLALSHSQ